MRWCNGKLFLIGGLLLTTGCAEDPFDLGGPRSCEIADQNEWVYRAMQHVYFWRDELPEVDPTTFESPSDLVRELRYDVDRWSRVSDQRRTEALFQEGKTISLGFATRRDPDSRVVVSLVHEHSPAGEAGMRRGDVIEGVGGYTVEELDDQGLWGDVYGPNEPGVDVDLVASRDGEARDIHLVKDWIDIITVPQTEILEIEGTRVGYLVFSSFLEPALVELNEAFGTFVEADVRNVIVDIRYNGGGLVRVARHMLNLLAGAQAEGKVAYRVEYNEDLSSENDVRHLSNSGNSIRNLETVTFITTRSSISATELVINALRPYVDVRVVGSRTGGKPVGSRHWAFCEQVLAPITFQIVNAEGFGDYFEGIEPDCSASDGLAHPLGDPGETALAEALHLLQTGSCSPPSEEDDEEEDGSPRRQDLDLHPEVGDLMLGWF